MERKFESLLSFQQDHLQGIQNQNPNNFACEYFPKILYYSRVVTKILNLKFSEFKS